MTVSDLAKELHRTVSEVQRVARPLGIAAKTPDYKLKSDDARRIRLALRDLALAAAAAPQPEAVMESGAATGAAGATMLATPVGSTMGSIGHGGHGGQGGPGGSIGIGPISPGGSTAIALRALPRPVARVTPSPARGEGATKVLLHSDLLEWLQAKDTDERLRRRAWLVLWQFLARGKPGTVKSVRGAATGWLRTRLGGNGGNHFYLWWAHAGAAPLEGSPLARGEVLLRKVRHHDETDTALPAGTRDDWFALSPAELAEEASPFTDDQLRAAREGAPIRLIKGHPGTGKTTTLWLATAWAAGEKALYVTYSRRLSAESELFFRSLGPRDLRVDVVTFEELLDELEVARGGPQGARLISPDEATLKMKTRLGGFQQRWQPWEEHEAELYAELHANFAGRALPVDFRGVQKSLAPALSTGAYLELRRSVLGDAAARAAAAVGDYLRKALPELMPGPLRARAALDHLAAGGTLPERFSDVDWIFIDEAQDLTLVEAYLLVEIGARLGIAHGKLPGFVAAGDEGQTVRPTDFEWGPLADLLNERFGHRDEFELAGNLRSPRDIATVVNRSWELYRRIGKNERPRGQARAEIEETAPGRIVYCRCTSDEDVALLLETFARTPNAALIYPGFRVAEAWHRPDVDVWTSETAKGLDFQIVGVLDAGQRLEAVHELASREGKIFALWARTLADQIRVALSRSTDTLVLIDRKGEPAWRDRIYELCQVDGNSLDGFLEEMSPQALAELFAREDVEPSEIVRAKTEDILKVLQDHPDRALREARNTTGLLGGDRTPGAVTDPQLRKETWRVRGVAALLAAMNPKLSEADKKTLFAESNRYLHKAQLSLAAKAALDLRDVRQARHAEGELAEGKALALAQSIDGAAREIPEAEAVLRNGIVAWSRASSEAKPPPGVAAKKRLVEAVEKLAAQLGARHPELVGHRETVRATVARALFDERHPKDALAQLVLLTERDHAAEAGCYEALSQLDDAVASYELAGDLDAALRCARRIPDFDKSLELARRLPERSPSVEWTARLGLLLDEAEEQGVVLTVEEEEALGARLERTTRSGGAGNGRKRARR